MEENGIPVAPAILGIVLGTDARGELRHLDDQVGRHLLAFFERPIAGTLGVMMIALLVVPTLLRLVNKRRTVSSGG